MAWLTCFLNINILKLQAFLLVSVFTFKVVRNIDDVYQLLALEVTDCFILIS